MIAKHSIQKGSTELAEYIVLARKYRPQTFDEIIGQEHIVVTLKNAIQKERIAHAYLFAGPSGVGKTSVARILAKAINCEKGPTPEPCGKCISCREVREGRSLDVLEIDGASNRGIDQVRTLRENVKLSPSHGRFKVYIIDEVHMLTTEAFNALLKTLEEPPPHVKFIFATTAPHKVILTILARCQRFDFRRIPKEEILKKLTEIARYEKVKVDEGALIAITRISKGSIRDAESIFDQLITFTGGRITSGDVVSMLGTIDEKLLFNVTAMIKRQDTKGAIQFLNDLIDKGQDISQFLSEFIWHIRNLLVARIDGEPPLIDASQASIDELTAQAKLFSETQLLYMFSLLSKTEELTRRSGMMRVALEMALVRLTKAGSFISIEDALEKLSSIEKQLGQGEGTPPPSRPSPSLEKQLDQRAEDTLSSPKPSFSEASGRPDIRKLKRHWPEVLDKIREKKMSVGSYLAEGEPVDIKDGVVRVGLDKRFSFNKESLEEPKNKALTEEVLSEVLGEKLTVEFVMVNIPVGSGGEKKVRIIPEQVIKDPIIQKVVDLFDAEVKKVERLHKSG